MRVTAIGELLQQGPEGSALDVSITQNIIIGPNGSMFKTLSAAKAALDNGAPHVYVWYESLEP